MNAPASDQLLSAVARRLHLNRCLQWFAFWLLWAGALYGIVLLLSRGTGIVSHRLTPATLAVVPVLALLASLVSIRRPHRTEVAHLVDRSGGTKDLFLTLTYLEKSCGEYQPIVVQQAETRATKLKPDAVAPWDVGRWWGYAVALLAGLAVGVIWLPQWDPFGAVASAKAKDAEAEKLLEDREATQTRIAQMKQESSESSDVSAADQSVDVIQAAVGTQWRDLGAQKLKALLEQNESMQEFGGLRMQKLDAWTDEVKSGETQMIRQELNDLADMAKAIANEKDPAKQAEMMREMKERLKDLERFASERAGSPEAAAAVRRAMRQMEAAGKQGMDEQMLKDLQESLELSNLEMEKLADAAKDLQKLEKALETMQMAKKLNQQGKLDGEAAGNCQTLEDYAALYKKMMQGQGENGDADGTGGEGIGRGGKSEEDDSVKTAFKEEKSKSAIEAGKSLLSMKTRGMSEEGVARKEYLDQVDAVKQSVSEAILQEQIPPGYHDSIRAFFDSDALPNAPTTDAVPTDAAPLDSAPTGAATESPAEVATP
jgi:hypothetical protein